MRKKNTAVNYSFIDFIKFLVHQKQRREIVFILGIYLLFYTIIIWLYPLPSTLVDSANYIHCASLMKIGGFRPFGYSWYLNFIHNVTPSITFLVISQFALNAFATLYFLFTVKYFNLITHRLLWYVFISFTVIAPISFYMANSLLSDSLFCSLTIVWFTTAIWCIHSGNTFAFFIHLIFMIWAMNVRYTALFFPIVSLFTAILSYSKLLRMISISVTIIITVFFYNSTKNKMRKEFGVDIFSGFGGWQVLNNALHIIPHVHIDPKEIKDKQTSEFYRFALQFDTEVYKKEISSSFIWSKDLPLKQYLAWRMRSQQLGYVKAWLLSGKDFEKYGSYLIKKEPVAFCKYYLLPNSLRVVFPPERGFIFSTDTLESDELISSWFKMQKGIKFIPASTLYSDMSLPLRMSECLINLTFLVCLVCWVFKKNIFLLDERATKALSMLVLFVLMYWAFNIYAAPYEIRYGIPVRPILVALPLILLNAYLSKKEKKLVEIKISKKS